VKLPKVYLSFAAASTNKSKLAKAMPYASCGAFVLLCLGAIFTYRHHQKIRHKSDVFVDVLGSFSFFCQITLSQHDITRPSRKYLSSVLWKT